MGRSPREKLRAIIGLDKELASNEGVAGKRESRRKPAFTGIAFIITIILLMNPHRLAI